MTGNFLLFSTGRLKKPRPNKYNLRSFSRQKAEILKEAMKKEAHRNKAPNKAPGLPTSSCSCPELREEEENSCYTTYVKEPCIEPKEPALSMGFVNLASDSDNSIDTDNHVTSELGFCSERSVSDSEINYTERHESTRRENETVGRFFKILRFFVLFQLSALSCIS